MPESTPDTPSTAPVEGKRAAPEAASSAPPTASISPPDNPHVASVTSADPRKPSPAPSKSPSIESKDPLAQAHHFFEHNAGWLTLLSGALVPPAVAIDDLRWAIAAVSLFLFCVILLFTRPLRKRSDIDTIFRFAWSFMVAVAIFGLLFLLFGDRLPLIAIGKVGYKTAAPVATSGSTTTLAPPAASRPGGPSGGPGAPAGPPAAPPNNPTPATIPGPPATTTSTARTDQADIESRLTSRSTYLLAVVPGCDYNSIAYKNPLASNATNPQAANQKTTPNNGASAPSAGNLLNSVGIRTPQSGMPEGVNCGELPPQWVLVIGGSILDCDFDGTCPKSLPRPNIAQLEADYQQANDDLKEAKNLRADISDKIDAQELDDVARGTTTHSGANPREQLATSTAKIHELQGKVSSAKSALDNARKFATFNLKIEGNPIIGGIVVPVFFIALALMGALVNMGRKIPEYQERVDPAYKEEFETKLAGTDVTNPPIIWPYARDLVVFQIIQVLSTPPIAILAYSWARPEDPATTVILAFAAGFTSEVFLLAIRGVVDRLIGLGPRPPRIRALTAADTPDALKSDIPPRGPANTSPASSGGFKVGDLVRLVQPVGPCMPGAEGIVLSIEPGGDLIVRTTRDHTGMPLNYRLQAQSPSAFQLASKPAPAGTTTTEPVG